VIASTLVGATILLQSKVTQTEQKYQRQFQELRDADSKKTIEYKQRLEDSSKLIEELKVQLQSKLDAKARLAAQQAAQAAAVTKVASQAVPHAEAAPVASNEAKMFIYMKESGNRTNAINKSSGACGLGQALPCAKMGCSLTDYACQDAFFTKYMQNRYGTWENAKAFWLSHKWW